MRSRRAHLEREEQVDPSRHPSRRRRPGPARLIAAALLAAAVGLVPAATPATPAALAAPTPTPTPTLPEVIATGDGAAGATTGDPDAAITRGQPAPPSASGAISTADQERVARYWTAERRDRAFGSHSAAPQDAAGTAAPLSTPYGDDPGSGPAAAPPPPPSDGTPYTLGGLVTTTTGRMFSSIGGSDFACSASVVTSRGRDLVVTAGHCLHGGSGAGFATNVAFVPDYSNGETPFGIWTARHLTVTPGWARGSNFDVDTGFALFNTQRGRHLQDVVGAQGIAFDLPVSYQQYSFGYPRLRPFDGSSLIYCAGPGTADTYGGPSIGVRCRMTAGSSGGPLIAGLGRLGPGHGWIDGVISYAYAGSDDRLFGTRFGAAVRLLYYQASAL